MSADPLIVCFLYNTKCDAAPNYSLDVRKMVYFRVSHKDHLSFRIQSLDDIWLGFEGMVDVL